jgi:hypothetical protein
MVLPQFERVNGTIDGIDELVARGAAQSGPATWYPSLTLVVLAIQYLTAAEAVTGWSGEQVESFV